MKPARSLALLLLAAACGDDAPPPKPPAPFPVRGAAHSAPAAVAADAAAPAGALTSTESSDPRLIELPMLTMPKPAAWIFVKPTMAFRTLQYRVPGAGGAGDADLIVSVFKAGDGGSVDDNIQRWSHQFTDAAGTPLTPVRRQRNAGVAAVTRVDLNGAWKGMGMSEARPDFAQLAAIVELPQQTVFVRLIGPAAVVEQARRDFETMIDGLRLRGETGR